MKKILVNDIYLHRDGAGIATYLANLQNAWPTNVELSLESVWRQQWHVFQRMLGSFRVPKSPERLAPLAALRINRKTFRLPFTLRNAMTRYYAGSLRRLGRSGRYAGYFEPAHLATVMDIPVVATCHDLSVLANPSWHPKDRVRQWEVSLNTALAATNHWIAVSEFTRREMMTRLNIPTEAITTIPLAARSLPTPLTELTDQLARANDFREYLFCHIGTIEPRKQLPLLLDAWASLPKDFRRHSRLIFIGGLGWGGSPFVSSLNGHPCAGDVLQTGYVNNATLATLLAKSTAVLLPSAYEGFGLPVLEAMQAGVPVVHSAAEALCEVADNAGIRVELADPTSWAEEIRRIAEDTTWRENRITAGRQRAAEFSWQQTVREHFGVFRKVFQPA